MFGSIPRPGSRPAEAALGFDSGHIFSLSTFKASKHQLSDLTKKNGSAVFGCFVFFKKQKKNKTATNREVNSEVPKTCFLLFGQQEWLKLIAKRLKMSGGQYRKENKICAFTNCFKKCLLV